MLDIVKYATDFFKLPGPALKKRWVGEYEAITTHTQGRVAKRLIKTRRPHEDEETQKYRRENYEPVTKGPFSRAKANLQRVFSASQVTVAIENEALQEFVSGANFDGMDLRSYWARKVTVRMIEDPNGVLVWWVKTAPELNEQAQPAPMLVLCKNIRHFTDEVFTWLSNEKSMVLAPDPAGGGRDIEQPLGDVYYIVTTDAYYKFVQVGKLSDGRFEMILHYQHDLGELPLDILGGDETSETNERTNEDEFWFTSYFGSAIPYANECSRQFSDHQAVLVNSGFPLKEVKPVKCVNSGCVEGYIKHLQPDDTFMKERCPVCKGRGKVPPFGPYGVLLREEKGVLGGGESDGDIPMVRFINPDPAILEFGGKTWRDYLKDVEKELNLLFIEEAQSGVAKEVDREDKVSKLDKMGHHLFMVLMRHGLSIVSRLMFGTDDPEGISIVMPPTFRERTEADLSEELKTVRESDTHSMFVSQVLNEYSLKRYHGDQKFPKMVEVLIAYDPLFSKTTEEIVSMQAVGVVDDVMVRRHMLCETALRRMVVRDPGVLEADNVFDLIDTEVEALMPQARIAAAKPAPEPAPIPPDGGNQ